MYYRNNSFLYTLNCANSHVIHKLCEYIAYISVFVLDAHIRLCFTLHTSPNMRCSFIEGCDFNLSKDYPLISSPVTLLHICYSLSNPTPYSSMASPSAFTWFIWVHYCSTMYADLLCHGMWKNSSRIAVVWNELCYIPHVLNQIVCMLH